jgi:hypothetical protein
MDNINSFIQNQAIIQKDKIGNIDSLLYNLNLNITNDNNVNYLNYLSNEGIFIYYFISLIFKK